MRYSFRVCESDPTREAVLSLDVPVDKPGHDHRIDSEAALFRSGADEIPGVEWAMVDGRYDIRVKKGKLFSWRDIRPEIVRLARKHFGGEE